MTTAMQIDILGALVALNTVAMFIIGIAIASFRRTIDKLDAADKDLTHRVTELEITSARTNGVEAQMMERLDTLITGLESLTHKVDERFQEYDRNIRDFYTRYELPLRK